MTKYPFHPNLEGNQIAIDLSDKKALKKLLRWFINNTETIKELCEEYSEIEYFEIQDGELTDETHDQESFFIEVVEHPDLHSSILKYIKAIRPGRYLDEEMPFGICASYALANKDPKYVKQFIEFLQDADIETMDIQNEYIQCVIQEWKAMDESLQLMAAYCNSLAGQQGMDISIEYLYKYKVHKGNDLTIRFLHYYLVDLGFHRDPEIGYEDFFYILHVMGITYGEEDIEPYIEAIWKDSFMQLITKAKNKPKKILPLDGFIHANDIIIEKKRRKKPEIIPEFYNAYLKWIEYFLLKNDFEKAQKFLDVLNLRKIKGLKKTKATYFTLILQKINGADTKKTEKQFHKLFTQNPQITETLLTIKLWQENAPLSIEVKTFIKQFKVTEIEETVDSPEKAQQLFEKALKTGNLKSIQKVLYKNSPLEKHYIENGYFIHSKLSKYFLNTLNYECWEYIMDYLINFSGEKKDWKLLDIAIRMKWKDSELYDKGIYFVLSSKYKARLEEYRLIAIINHIGRVKPITMELYLDQHNWKSVDDAELASAVAECNNIPTFNVLLKKGASINSKRTGDSWALHCALKYAWGLEQITKMVEYGALINYENISWEFIKQETNTINLDVKSYLEKMSKLEK